MVKKLVLVLVMITFSLSTYAKKDINAWKKENKLDTQYKVFKENLNFWDGSFFCKEFQIDAFYKAVTDSINILDSKIESDRNSINGLNSTISNLNTDLETTQTKLDESLTREDSFTTLGIQVSKSSFATVMYVISIILIILAGVLFFLFKQSHLITKEAKEKFEDLDKEFDLHKKNNLERFTKLNRELHDARMQLGKL